LAAACSSAAVGVPAVDGVLVDGLVVEGLVVAAGFDVDGVFAGGVLDEPQPAISAALAAATTNDEYSFRVMVPPCSLKWFGSARCRPGI
jgi:hypothetical protein